GGGMGGGMMGQTSQKSLETIVARAQYGFASVERALKGADPKGGKNGVMTKLTATDEKTVEAKTRATSALEEFKSTNELIEKGPQTPAGGMMGMGMGSGMMGGTMGGMAAMGAQKKGSVTIRVDAASLKDHLLEKKNRYNEIMGIDSF
ncbi:MAG: hypothetical protein HUK22_02775, partial [Thermoguttaceae bacterium]|nr:hypothetical protein [Thermoguttaceae bacterium]